MWKRLLSIANEGLQRLLTEHRRRAWAMHERSRRHFGPPSLRFSDLHRGYGEREALGLKLLKEWLSPEQLAQYNANKYFEVIGSDSGKRYRISHGAAMNVHELDGAGRPRIGWCFVPKGYLVAGDVMLAQKIALETDERGALAVANRYFVPPSRRNMHLHY